jgi:hypothetical protein
VLTSPADERPAGRNDRFLLFHGFFVKRRHREIPLRSSRANAFAVEVWAALHAGSNQKAPKV